MTHLNTKQPEALRLADKYEVHGFMGDHHFAKDHWCSQAAAELRSLHTRVQELEKSESDLIAERDYRDEIIDLMADAVLGTDRAEWSSSYDFMDAAEEIKDRIAELKTELALTTATADIPISKSATVSDAQIKAVFLANGFTIKPGCDDLKPYVYQAARALLATTGQAQSAAPKLRPEAWLATFRPKGMLSPHSIAGVNLEELKRQVPSDSVFKPLYTRHAEGATAQAGAYAEARKCEHCNHVGINDAANGIASCTACKWNGDSPKEDKCPDCEAEGTMTASCPKCHHEYRLIADATLSAIAAQAKQGEQQL